MTTPDMRIWIAADVTDMRSGFNSLAACVQTVLEKRPYLCGSASIDARLTGGLVTEVRHRSMRGYPGAGLHGRVMRPRDRLGRFRISTTEAEPQLLFRR